VFLKYANDPLIKLNMKHSLIDKKCKMHEKHVFIIQHSFDAEKDLKISSTK